jgi:hypothetical protein
MSPKEQPHYCRHRRRSNRHISGTRSISVVPRQATAIRRLWRIRFSPKPLDHLGFEYSGASMPLRGSGCAGGGRSLDRSDPHAGREHRTLLTIIAALGDYSGFKLENRGASPADRQTHGTPSLSIIPAHVSATASSPESDM